MRYLLIVIVSLVGAIACANNEAYTSPTKEESASSLTITIPHFKDVYGGLYIVSWRSDDCVSVDGTTSQSIDIDSKKSNCATFNFGDKELRAPYQVVYPIDAESGVIHFSADKNIVEGGSFPQGMPMCSYVENGDGEITMNHLTSVICLNITSKIGEIVLNKITLEAETAIAGEFALDSKSATLTPLSEVTTTLSYNFANGYRLAEDEDNLIYINLPAGELGNCTFTLYATNGHQMTLEWRALNAKAGQVVGSSLIQFVKDGYAQLEGMKNENDTITQRYPIITGYVRDNEGKPIEGVAVSDGFSVVATDSEGYYSLKIVQDAWYIFISVPAEYKIPINDKGQPCFFKRYPSQTSRYNFTLERMEGGAESEFLLFAFADPQVGKLTSVNRFSRQVAPEIKSYSASLGVPCYGITLGDVISMGSSDISQTVLPAMREAMHAERMGMPVFQIMGNHDNCFMSATRPVEGRTLRDINLNIQRMFEEAFGPINYSFNRGDAHIVGMRNVQWKSGDNCASENTTTSFTKEQYDWLVEDLAQVPKDRAVVLCVHVPLYNSGKIGDGSYRQEVLTLLDQFAEAHVLSGHLHYQRNYDHTAVSSSQHKIYEHAQAAVNGASWTSNINGDGVPNGYGIYHFSGNTIKDWYYKGYAKGMDKREQQMRLYRGNAITGAAISGSNREGTKGYYQFGYDDDILLANVFNSDTQWKVEVYEDGVYSGDMTSLAAYHWDITYDQLIGSYTYADPKRPPVGAECGRDFWAVGVLCGYLGANSGGLYYKHCYQMWKYKLKNKDANIEVRATDRKGNVYTENKITGGDDFAIALYNENDY